MLLLLLLLMAALSAANALPARRGQETPAVRTATHLQVNYQRAPALGVGPLLRFSWAPPPSTGGRGRASGVQQSYRIAVTERVSGTLAWDSGIVNSSASINVEVDARTVGIRPGQAYRWSVSCDGGPRSARADFVTALWDGFHPGAGWVWAQDTNASRHYANLRHVVGTGANRSGTVVQALLYVTAWLEPTMLSAYKFYIDGRLVSLGPGRGEANVLQGNSTFLQAPYATVDVTGAGIQYPGSVLAIEGMAPLFQAPCRLHACRDYNTGGGGVLAQLVLTFEDGTTDLIATGASPWAAAPADAYRNPTAPGVQVADIGSQTAYAKILENVRADREVVGWKTAAAVSPAWPAAAASPYQAHDQLVAKMARPLQVYDVGPVAPAPAAARNAGGPGAPPSFFYDFGRELQGGIVLTVGKGAQGTRLRLVTGELLLPNGTVDATTRCRIAPSNTWGYELNWTLRDGPQVIRQHDYMLFRYLSIEVTAGAAPTNLTVSAWGVKYEYGDADSAFASDNATLNAVHELARWTLDGGVLDTYTDSNTRERRPYECDGLIAASNRALIQGDQMWARHSHSWVLEVPTWPVEWMQMSALLAWQDYMATGSVDLFRAYEARLHTRTQVALVDATGLVNTSTGRHLVGWDPPPTQDMFRNSEHTSVCNAWAVGGLEALATMAAAAGSGNASLYAGQAAGIRSAMGRLAWDSRSSRYCDGICSDPRVAGHTGVTTAYFSLYHDLVPTAAAHKVWSQLAAFGLRQIGDYGAHIFLNALAKYPGDDGTAMLTALTKCDEYSWCNEMATFNATMTTESLGVPHQTMSHPWGTGALSGIVHGVAGLHQTSAAWGTFTVKPQLASLAFVNVTVPTIRGPIAIAAKPQWLAVAVPCNTAATLCLQVRGAAAAPGRASTLQVDGEPVASVTTAQHICTAEAVRCAAHPRRLTLAP